MLHRLDHVSVKALVLAFITTLMADLDRLGRCLQVRKKLNIFRFFFLILLLLLHLLHFMRAFIKELIAKS